MQCVVCHFNFSNSYVTKLTCVTVLLFSCNKSPDNLPQNYLPEVKIAKYLGRGSDEYSFECFERPTWGCESG